ncbi:uncharacterized protein LOC133805983 [Humulus lupulus]|uniref:uncharacterized protein LOC133805983 n=1 Tax=Humulus lupulus TaxID=3486 RepID=UPI002B40BB10|nr:uncharacterized protein LOC133805983 [Humulus lupulus]
MAITSRYLRDSHGSYEQFRLKLLLRFYKEIIGQLNPEILTHSVNYTPQSDIAGWLNLPSDVVGRMKPIYEVTGRMTPISEMTGRMTPIYEVTGWMTPIFEMTGQMTPISKMTSQMTPTFEVTSRTNCVWSGVTST